MIQPLEPRLCLSADFDATTGILNIVGTASPDVITFSKQGSAKHPVVRMDFNGKTSDFDFAKILLIHVNGGQGADSIAMGTLKIPAILDGADGNDSLSGGEGDDTISGQGGENYLFGRGGGDRIVAGLQADSIFGAAGNDYIIPDKTKTADDTISGGSGVDTVDYSDSPVGVKANIGATVTRNQANDHLEGDIEGILGSQFPDQLTNGTKRGAELHGQGGNDTITGGSGNDSLDGGSGRDSLIGNGGRDHFRSKDGKADTLDGGSGLDFPENTDIVEGIDVITNIP